MKDFKAKIEWCEIDKVIPYHNNTKKHPEEQVNKIASQIKEFGFDQPITVDKYMIIITGHGRIQACKKLGIKRVPFIIRDDLTEAQIRAKRIADNKVAESEWDEDLLKVEFDLLKEENFDLGLTGFDFDANLGDDEEQANDDDVPVLEEAEVFLNKAWQEWAIKIVETIDLLSEEKIFFQNVNEGYLKISFLNSLYYGKRFPSGATTAFQYHRMFCSGDGDNGSIYDFLKLLKDDISKVPRIRFALQEKPSLEKLLTVAGIPMAGHKAPLDFPVDLATSLYNEFAKNGKILDPCHGWGGRFIGFMLSNASYYMGVDVSPDSSDGLKRISRSIHKYRDDKNFDFMCSPFEECQLEKEYYDFAMTSPPYFDREIYIGGEQAHTKYKNYDDFINGFYYDLFKNTYIALKENCFFALQVGNQKYDLDKQAERIAKDVGFFHIETRPTAMKRVGADKSEKSSELILIFKKGVN